MAYERGLHEVGDGVWAWLQPDGSWGWSNAGLVVDAEGDKSLLVDTLFDEKLTAAMLEAMRAITPSIDVLVNTHANGDHCYGNSLVAAQGAEIVASSACAAELAEVSPAVMVGFMEAAPGLGEMGEYLLRIFGPFTFEGIELTLPTKTFDGSLTLSVGDRRVELLEVGPAHTRGDVIAVLPDAGVVFTGDICFIGGHPIIWEGPVGNYVKACDRVIDSGAATVVPGHGPVCGVDEVRTLRGYFEWLERATTERYAGGLSPLEAARDIHASLGATPYADWTDSERIAVNVASIYRELGSSEPTDVITLFSRMAELATKS